MSSKDAGGGKRPLATPAATVPTGPRRSARARATADVGDGKRPRAARAAAAPGPARRSARVRTAALRAAAPAPAPAVSYWPKKRRAASEAPGAPPPKQSLRACNGYVSWPGGGGRCPTTVFLGGDGLSVSVRPVLSVGMDTPRFCGRGFAQASDAALARVERLDEYWTGNQSGKDSAAPIGLHPFRHIGVVKLEKVELTAEIDASPEDGDWGPGQKAAGVVNLKRELARKLLKGNDQRTRRLLEVLHLVTADDATEYPTPLMLALVEERALTTMGRGGGQLHVHVLAGRLMFEMIAFGELRELFENLDNQWREELPELPKFEQKFGHSQPDGQEDYYSFPALLRRAENVGYRDIDPELERKVDEKLTVSLLPFQRDTVQFMVDRATDRRALNDYFWQRLGYTQPDALKKQLTSCFYYFPLAGEVRLRAPPRTRGGAICEEMGLGKTIECIAFILACQEPYGAGKFTIRKDEVDSPVLLNGFVTASKKKLTNRDTALASRSHRDNLLRYGDVVMSGLEDDDSPDSTPVVVQRWPAKTTLVILPLSLLYQWRDEVTEKAPSLTIHVWDRNKSTADVAVGEDAVDIVLATYEQMSKSKIISQIHWKSLILDEAQVIRRSMTAVAKDAFNLRSDSRFLMTGTPLTNTLNDIGGEFAFLKIWPFTLDNDGFWEHWVEHPWKQRANSELLDRLLSATMMRHTKGQDGIGIQLPSRSYRTIETNLSGSSSAVYKFIRSCAEEELERLQPTLRPQLRHVRSLFNLLRASAVSAALVNTFALDFARRVVWAARIEAQNPDLVGNYVSPVDWSPETIARQIGEISVDDALKFVGSANGGALLRDTRRSFAVGESAQRNPAIDPKFRTMSMEELVADAILKEVADASEASSLSRARLIGLIAGGVQKLATDSDDEMRDAAVAANLLSEDEAKDASRNRLTQLLKSHILLSSGLDVTGTVHQAGFQTLAKLSETGEMPDCPVCLDDCTRPCIAACAHFYCHECIVAFIGSFQGRAKCALCRREIVASKVAEIKKSSIGRRKKALGAEEDEDNDVDDDDDDDDEDDDDDDDDEDVVDDETEAVHGASSSGGEISNSGASEVDVNEVVPSNQFSGSAVTGPTATDMMRAYERLPAAPARFNGLGYNGMTPSLDVQLLRHIASAREEPAKFHALEELIRSEAADTKFVVVAEAANTLQACGRWLSEKGIECVGVGIDSGSLGSRLHSKAAHEFKTEPAKRVFLLNTISSSGLTLTAASHVVFLEPLIRKADEIQASARVHRIGQTKEVKIVRMVARGTVEESLIAARGGSAPRSAAEEASALASVSSSNATDEMILQVLGWERLADGHIRRLRSSA